MPAEVHQQEKIWYLEYRGERKGPFSADEMRTFISNRYLNRDSIVWRKGLEGWIALSSSELSENLSKGDPPPIPGENVDGSIVWTLAFAPLIGLLIEGLLEEMMSSWSGSFWLVTPCLNVILSVLDEKKLSASGYDTSGFKGWTWLVPVYLFQRSKILKHNLAYFFVWIVCFILMLSAFDEI